MKALAALAGAVGSGAPNLVSELADKVETLAYSFEHQDWQAEGLASLAAAMADAGERDRAIAFIGKAESSLLSVHNPGHRADITNAIVTAMVHAGEYSRAASMARTLDNPWEQADALVAVVRAMAEIGDYSQAEALADSIIVPDQQAQAYIELAQEMDLAHAETLVARACRVGELDDLGRVLDADPSRRIVDSCRRGASF